MAEDKKPQATTYEPVRNGGNRRCLPEENLGICPSERSSIFSVHKRANRLSHPRGFLQAHAGAIKKQMETFQQQAKK
jgi:hypothetical protein